MISETFFNTLIWGMTGMAVVVFVCLFFVTAGHVIKPDLGLGLQLGP